VIALEDVGHGDVGVVEKALLIASDAGLREQLGAERALIWLAGQLAAVPGERAPGDRYPPRCPRAPKAGLAGAAPDQGHLGSMKEDHGIYRIYHPENPEVTVRAGRTKTGVGGLRQRVYQNHFMGDQKGNLRAQLVRGGVCPDLVSAKEFIRASLVVQVLAIPDPQDRASLEHFMLAVLRPRYSD
jgi:hypothetical protein